MSSSLKPCTSLMYFIMFLTSDWHPDNSPELIQKRQVRRGEHGPGGK